MDNAREGEEYVTISCDINTTQQACLMLTIWHLHRRKTALQEGDLLQVGKRTREIEEIQRLGKELEEETKRMVEREEERTELEKKLILKLNEMQRESDALEKERESRK